MSNNENKIFVINQSKTDKLKGMIFPYNKIWFTADPHLFHKNIIGICNRPYNDVNEMWEDFKNKWNSKVKDDDYVFILGDFIWNSSKEKVERICKQLKGNKIIILGNHDKEKSYLTDEIYYVGKLEKIRVNDINNSNYIYEIILCHYPLASWDGSFRGNIQLFGHCHCKFPEEKQLWNQFDVGFDRKYDLWSMNELMDIFSKRLIEKGGL